MQAEADGQVGSSLARVSVSKNHTRPSRGRGGPTRHTPLRGQSAARLRDESKVPVRPRGHRPPPFIRPSFPSKEGGGTGPGSEGTGLGGERCAVAIPKFLGVGLDAVLRRWSPGSPGACARPWSLGSAVAPTQPCQGWLLGGPPPQTWPQPPAVTVLGVAPGSVCSRGTLTPHHPGPKSCRGGGHEVRGHTPEQGGCRAQRTEWETGGRETRSLGPR